MDAEPSWREQRREAFRAHSEALARQKEAETERARGIVADFVAGMTERGVPPHPLRARSAGGGTYRTALTGWYIRRNHSLAVDPAGRFYILDVPSGLGHRVFGAHVEPSDPPLHVGVGARDGESMPLEALLQLRLGAGADWP